jgi:hypothetical protein
MLKKLALGLATMASLSLGAAALAPALANYGTCTEDPSAKGCPGYIAPAPEFQGGVGSGMQSTPRHLAHHVRSHQGYSSQKG